MKQISIIVPMFNEALHIRRTLESAKRAADFARLDYELLVIDNGSTDQGPQLAEQSGARLLRYPGLSIAALRNRGASASTSTWLAFLDADIEVPLDWLQQCQAARQAERGDVVALDCDTPPGAPWYARAWQRRGLSGNDPRLREWLPTPNLYLSRAWFDRVDGFDERLRTGEDKDFSLRLRQAGARLLGLPKPVVLNWGFEQTWGDWLGKELWRQSSALQGVARSAGSLRRMRFALLCLTHCLVSLTLLFSLGAGLWQAAGGLALLSLASGFGLALRQSGLRDPRLLAQLWVLHWIRLHLGGAACVIGLFNIRVRRPARD